RFDLWELDGRDLVLYWRDLAPGVRESLSLDLVARVPGRTEGPASRVRLYYTPQHERWAAPLGLTVRAKAR
ncbi:MAG: hypothetical protein KC656_23040, partial [Myxococcales bacterium]|nr:hypothetical protein [Myxococcales bacterium]